MTLHLHIHHADSDLDDELERVDKKIQDMEDKGLAIPRWMREKRESLSVHVNKSINAKEKFAAMKTMLEPKR